MEKICSRKRDNGSLLARELSSSINHFEALIQFSSSLHSKNNISTSKHEPTTVERSSRFVANNVCRLLRKFGTRCWIAQTNCCSDTLCGVRNYSRFFLSSPPDNPSADGLRDKTHHACYYHNQTGGKRCILIKHNTRGRLIHLF